MFWSKADLSWQNWHCQILGFTTSLFSSFREKLFIFWMTLDQFFLLVTYLGDISASLMSHLFVHFLGYVNGPVKVNLKFSFSFSGFHFRVLTRTFIRVSNLRFTSFFNFSFSLFLSNCWLLAFGFLQGSAVKPRFMNFFSQLIIAFLLSNQESMFSKSRFSIPSF